MNSKQSGRRRFLKEGAALALLSQGAGGLAGLAVGAVRSASGQTVRQGAAPPRKAQRSMRRSAWRATGQPWKEPSSVLVWWDAKARSTPLTRLELWGVTGRLRRRYGTITTTPYPTHKGDPSARTRFTL